MAVKKIKTSGKDRKCKYPGCSHILSIYNHEEYCYIHQGGQFRGKRMDYSGK